MEKLGLNQHSITDISPLANLTKITNLNLNDNQIEDISPLANLTKITDLSLKDNQIEDLRPLRNLKALNRLYLDDNPLNLEYTKELAKEYRYGDRLTGYCDWFVRNYKE